jgi:N-acetylglucosaminyl-diphospho-decaprenol L-rhamnosyltransferase
MPALSVVVVTFNSRDDVARALPALAGQLREGDELIVVDNGSTDGTVDEVARAAPVAKLIRNGVNEGFAAACNLGAEAARGELLLLLNPDATPQPAFREAIERPLTEGRGWAAWQGLVLRDGGRLINTEGNRVHFTGFSWAGGDGLPATEAAGEPRPVDSLSGTCLALPLADWRRLGGFPPDFFTYHEDTDLSMRLRLEGGSLGVEPGAAVDHDYEFSKPAGTKWRHLERNRWALLIRTYPGPLLALIFPALMLTELALLPISIAGGWIGAKLRADLELLGRLPRLLRERRAIQRARSIDSGEFAAVLTPDLDSDYLGRTGRVAPLRWGLRAYWRVVLALLGSRPASAEELPSGEPEALPAAEPPRERSS